MQAEALKGWIAEARRGEKERETATKDGGKREKSGRTTRREQRTGRGWWT